MSTTTTKNTYRIIYDFMFSAFVVEGPDGRLLRSANGTTRTFKTRNSARKRISREKSGNFSR